MNDKPETTAPKMIDCDVCHKEIPQSVAMTEEGEDYVLHFCGLECYTAWKSKNEKSAD